MALVTPTLVTIPQGYIHTWAMLTADVEGVAIAIPGASDKCIQFFGTNWGAATIAVQGSNDGTNFVALTDPQGNALSKTADAIEQILENPRFLRVYLTVAGTAAVISAILYSRSK